MDSVRLDGWMRCMDSIRLDGWSVGFCMMGGVL